MKDGFILLFLTCCMLACSPEEEILKIDTIEFVTNIQAIDFKNNENAGDIILLFRIENPGAADQVEIFIYKSSEFEGLQSELLLSLPTTSFQSVQLEGNTYEVELKEGLLDIHGASLKHDEDYTIGFLVEKAGEKFLNVENEEIQLADGHFLNGDYQGTWDDNLYTGFGITAKIEVSAQSTIILGDFFYSSSFTSCCGGTNDGTISFRLSDEGVISDFRYAQNLVSFMGGACPGTYTGEGILENYTTLKINFSGDDCEGPHTGGRIVLNRIQ